MVKKECCSNPLRMKHTKALYAGCRPMMKRIVDVKKLTGTTYAIGKQVICPMCRKEIQKQVQELDSIEEHSSDIELSRIESTSSVNSSAAAIDISLLKFQKVSSRDSKVYAKKKVSQFHTAITKKIAIAAGFEQEQLLQGSKEQCMHCKEYDILLDELKTKIKTCSKRSEKLQILNLCPKNWSVMKVMNEFHVSQAMVRTARMLHQKDEILAMPPKKLGRPLSSETKDLVHSFYLDDEY